MNSFLPLGTAVAVVAWMATGAHGFRLWAGLVLLIVLPLMLRAWPQRLRAVRSVRTPAGVGRWAARVAVELIAIFAGTALLTPWEGPSWDVDPRRMFLAFAVLGAAVYFTFRIETHRAQPL